MCAKRTEVDTAHEFVPHARTLYNSRPRSLCQDPLHNKQVESEQTTRVLSVNHLHSTGCGLPFHTASDPRSDDLRV
jgi:hypothetical protein